MEENIICYFPINIQKILRGQVEKDNIEEIHLRTNRPIILKTHEREKILEHIITYREISEILQRICENSIYSYQNQICNGFITVKGGHRVGIAGNVIIENNKIININYISSINFRIAREVIGCSNKILEHILNLQDNSIYNTLIISVPGAGKTTILRDIIRNISNGIPNINFHGLTVSVVDERGELAATYKGIQQNDIGLKTDVLTNISKGVGLKMLIRSMAPQVIVADEIGSDEDIEAINYATCSGVKGVFTAHGACLKEVVLNPVLRKIIETHIIEKIIFLKSKGEKGGISQIYTLDKTKCEYQSLE